MSAEEKDMLRRIAEGMNALPESEQKYILGFAEGALAAAKRPATETNPNYFRDAAQDSA